MTSPSLPILRHEVGFTPMFPEEISLEALRAEVGAYREARLARLRSSTGWLSIVSKTWITDGTYQVGAAPGSDIPLPGEGAPALVGTVTRAGNEVRFDTAPGVSAQARGGAVWSVVMRSDSDPDPDQIAVGALRIELIRRGDDFAVRVRDTAGAAAAAFPGIPAFEVDPRARVIARFEPHALPLEIEIPDSDGRMQAFPSPGAASFVFAGVSCRLDLLSDGGGQRLFVLFGDATNGDETYGAGRFLYAANPIEGRLVLDFNKAFNPPCAFTSFASCPLPPPGNRLPVRIEAGEKVPAG